MEVAMLRRRKPRGGVALGFLPPGGDVTTTDLTPWMGSTGIDFGAGDGAAGDDGTVDPSTLYAPPGFNIQTTPAPEMSAAELAREQAAARASNAQIGRAVTTAAQIAAGVASGAMRVASASEKTACRSGFVYPNGDCVLTAPGTKPAGQWFDGVTNQTVVLAGGAVLGVVVLVGVMNAGGGGGRRR